jgi:hypothetical protein
VEALVGSGLGVRAIAMQGGILQVREAREARTEHIGVTHGDVAWNPALDPGWGNLAHLFTGAVADPFVNVVLAPPDATVGASMAVLENFATINRANVAITTLPARALPPTQLGALLAPLWRYDLVVCPTEEIAIVVAGMAGVEAVGLDPGILADAEVLRMHIARYLQPDFIPWFNPTVH